MKINSFLNFISYNVTEDNEVKIITGAEYSYSGLIQKIVFKEQDKEFKDCLTTITIENDEKVTVSRSGNYSTLITAQKNKRNISQHATPFGTYTLGITLSEFDSTLNEEGGELKFTYKTDTDFNLVSEIRFNIKIKKKKSK